MKIAILSRNPRLYSTRRLSEAARERGHQVNVLDTLRFAIELEGQNPELYYAGRRLKGYDAVIPRIGASITFYGCAVVRQFEQMGVFTLANSHAISVSRDKLRCLQVLSRHDIGMPETAFVRDRSDVLPAIERVGGVPVIIKVIEGTQGRGVILADNTRIAQAIIETLHGVNQNVLIQKFVAESRGTDLRAFVVGDEVVASMRRSAGSEGEYRSNVHLGGSVQAVSLDEAWARTAVHAAQILGLRVAGVDLLESDEGPKVMEVNSSPGLEGIEAATGVDVAGAIIDHLQQQARFPEIDLRQRLTLKSGYGVVEFTVTPESDLLGVTLAQAQLRERDVLVLSINRQGVTIPNPRGDREILLGDQLLCYGKMLTLSSLAPQPTPRPRKKRKKPAGASKPARKPPA